MASTPPETSSDNHAIVKRAVMRLSGLPQSATDASENTVDLVNYLVNSGIRDEDDLVELAEIANGKRYDPANGSFL
ncbi:hypothetical protein [Peteryoungia ipomoeae]|uniref:Uncharacterized protein n=1 Tax=Peteryoungia ipomoeae TaxID=1210932 RepID=A0A4S8NZZ2_9HYPH|nr:hypothetical protein [Peteryoungia ipomoeae]THV22445.1 hypothetical protein FAA97_14295 [Peteryoungia ipomoeae]